MALLVVLVIMMAAGGSAASFIWLMNQQQTRSGLRYRTAAATALAEAGVHRAMAVLEGEAPDIAPAGRLWRPQEYVETMATANGEGKFTLSIADGPGGVLNVTSTGEIGGVIKRLRARVLLASPSLLTALYAPGIVQLQAPPTTTVIAPYGSALGDRPWVHIAAGREIWFTRTDVLLNDPSARVERASGPSQVPSSWLGGSTDRAGPVHLLLARDAELTVGRTRVRVDVQQLRAAGLFVEGAITRVDRLPAVPDIDRAYFRGLAALNTSNALINEAAGKSAGNADLAQKRDSVYSETEFEQVQMYVARMSAPSTLRGTVYLRGALLLNQREHLRLVDGTMVVEGAVYLSARSTLEITHSPSTRALPGLIALENSNVVVTEGVRLRIHGLVYVTKTIAIDDGAEVEIVGAVVTGDPSLSFRNTSGTVVIRYDAAVLGTPGLTLPPTAPVVAWIASWEDLP